MRKKVCFFAIAVGAILMYIGYRLGADLELMAEALEKNFDAVFGNGLF